MSGGCVGSYCKTPEEFTAARVEFIRAHRYEGASPKEWLASYVAEKEREQAEALRRKAEEEAAARKAKQFENENRAKRIANLRDASSIGASVYSAKYGICTITSFRLSSNGKFEYISISTPEGIKEFPFPDCFESGFLSIEQKNSREGLV